MITKYPIKNFVDKINDPSEIPAKISKGIIETVDNFVESHRSLDESAASYKPEPQKWSKKEILGHLIDSASNNHQRFVRAQYMNSAEFISYEQNEWVQVQQYNKRSWKELLELWKSYNQHLAHIIAEIPTRYLDLTFTIGSNEPVSLGYIIVDYLGHMQHHLDQINKK